MDIEASDREAVRGLSRTPWQGQLLPTPRAAANQAQKLLLQMETIEKGGRDPSFDLLIRGSENEQRKVYIMADANFGQWTGFDFTISPEAQKVFKEAMEHIVGVKYTPVAVATQVVAGMNYCFICEGQVVYPGSPETAFKIYIYVPPQEKPQIVAIERILP